MVITARLLETGRMVSVYQPTEIIGKGGFAEVWSALDTRLNRLVALKIIPIDDTPMSAGESQFRREALMVTQLEHNHILPLYDFGEEKSFRYLVMRYVTGGTLTDRLRGGVLLSPKAIIQWMSPIAATLDYIHEQRIVHRDLKPANILFDAQDVPYLTDFGLAKALSESTQQLHSTAGTPVYMPPEQFCGDVLSIHSDQYSLGIMLYQLFTGTVPYNGDMPFGLRQIASNDVLPDVTMLRPDLPVELNVWLQALTARDPEKRPVSASAVIRSIADLFSGLNITSTELVPHLFAPDKTAYRQYEANLLLEKYLFEWKNNTYSISRTHFILLHMTYGATAEILMTDARSLMLRGAFDTGLQLDDWWVVASELERKRAAWNAFNSPDATVRLRVINRITSLTWSKQVSSDSLNQIGGQLLPLSDVTATLLDFLEGALPRKKEWLIDDRLSVLDENLGNLAKGDNPLAKRAAKIIGVAHRTGAVRMLPMKLADVTPILNVYEAAGSLPRGYSVWQRMLLQVLLARRQLMAAPLAALRQYLLATIGNGLGIALMVFVVYRSLALVNNVRIVNALGQGFIFGAIYGLGVWLTRHFRMRLHNLTLLLRIPLAVLSGGLVVALGFNIYHQLVYDDVMDIPLSVLCGILYVMGFVVSEKLPVWIRIFAGAGGVAAAYLIPWWLYLQPDSIIQPPFFFDESNTPTTVLLVAISALILSMITTGDRWLLKRVRQTIPEAAFPPASEESPGDPFETIYL